jgi:hypothetical protein
VRVAVEIAVAVGGGCRFGRSGGVDHPVGLQDLACDGSGLPVEAAISS